MKFWTTIGEVAAVGVGFVTFGLAVKALQEPRRAQTYRPRRRVFVSVFEKETGDMVFANVEVVAEEDDRNGHYRFHRPDGRVLPLDLTDGNYRIVRRFVDQDG